MAHTSFTLPGARQARGLLRAARASGALALALLAGTSAFAYSTVELSVGGTTYTVAVTQQRSYNDCSAAVTTTPWWGNPTLAAQLATALGGTLGAPTGGSYGPMFGFQTYGAGPTGVDNAAWSKNDNQVYSSNGSGWPVGNAGAYAVDPTSMASTGNCTSAALATAAPALQSVTPATGPMTGGTSITISGHNFSGATAVTIGGTAAASFTEVNDTTITAVTPAGSLGAQSVVVTTSGGGSNTANTLFTYGKLAQATLAATASPSSLAVNATSTLGSTGGSGTGAVSFAVTSGAGHCSVTGSTLTGTSVGACTVTATKAADADYQVATATVDLTVTEAPIDASCGALPAMSFKPTAGLCSAGTLNAAGVTRLGIQWAWACDGAHGGSSTTANACTANFGATGNQSGAASVELGTGGGWVFAPNGTGANQTSGFIPATGHAKSPPHLPPGYSFPHALFDFVLTGGSGAATITLSYPSAIPASAVYWKYGPSPQGHGCSGAACASPHWYQMPSAQVAIAGNTITLTIHDGGVGDDDLVANGVIVDQGGPGVPLDNGTTPIPTLSEWALMAMAALMLMLGLRHARTRGPRARRLP